MNLQTSKFSLTKRVGSAGEIHAQSLLNMVHFGLGEKAKPVKISVRWRNGEEQVLPKSAFKDAKLLYELGIKLRDEGLFVAPAVTGGPLMQCHTCIACGPICPSSAREPRLAARIT